MNEESKTTITLLTKEARQEHADLHKLLETVRNQIGKCSEGKPGQAGSCLVKVMKQLCEHVENHFDREENGGWLEEAVVRLPHLSRRLRVLERQHKPLSERVRSLLAFAETFDGRSESVEQLRNNFEVFSRLLLIHELSEDRLLQRGFNEDLELA